MVVSDWLRPAYDGVDRIRAVAPVELVGSFDPLASGHASTRDSPVR
jgi:hypothetical protein